MSLKLTPITETIGTHVHGIDLSKTVSYSDFELIHRAWMDTTLLLFRDQNITPAQQIEFTKRFGEIVAYYDPTEKSLPGHPEVLLLSNIGDDGKPSGKSTSAYLWHVDGHYLPEPPVGSMLYSIIVPPEGGDTWFTNTKSAYEALPDNTKEKIEGLKIVISRVQSRPYNFPEKPPVTDEQRAA